jgi:hypothetical protein
MIACNAENSITKNNLQKKRLAMSASVICNFKKIIDLHKKVNFVEDLGLLIIKSHLPI